MCSSMLRNSVVARSRKRAESTEGRKELANRSSDGTGREISRHGTRLTGRDHSAAKLDNRNNITPL